MELFGSFVLHGVPYTSAVGEPQLAGYVEEGLISELAQFGLPGLQEASLMSVTNR